MKWFPSVFSAEIRKIFAYRVDFWFEYLMTIAAHIGVAYFLWQAVFTATHATVLRGYTFTGLMFYYLLVPLVQRIVLGVDMGRTSREIYDGSLTRYLIYPVSFVGYKMAQNLAALAVFFAQLVLAVGVFLVIFGQPADVHITLSGILMTLPAIVLGALLAFSINMILEMVAFWADNVWSLLVMVRFCIGILGGAMIPLSFFPDAARTILAILPFSYLASFPINLVLGKIGPAEWAMGMGIMIGWIVLFQLVGKIVWDAGRYRYTGVGI